MKCFRFLSFSFLRFHSFFSPLGLPVTETLTSSPPPSSCDLEVVSSEEWSTVSAAQGPPASLELVMHYDSIAQGREDRIIY